MMTCLRLAYVTTPAGVPVTLSPGASGATTLREKTAKEVHAKPLRAATADRPEFVRDTCPGVAPASREQVSETLDGKVSAACRLKERVKELAMKHLRIQARLRPSQDRPRRRSLKLAHRPVDSKTMSEKTGDVNPRRVWAGP